MIYFFPIFCFSILINENFNIINSLFSYISFGKIQKNIKLININNFFFSNSLKPIIISSIFDNYYEKQKIIINESITFRKSRFEAIISEDPNLGGALDIFQCHLYLDQCLFSANQGSFGAGIKIVYSRLENVHTNYSKNIAEILGGAIYSLNSELFSDYSFFSGCNSNQDAGALLLSNSDIILTNCNFNNNIAVVSCGGIQVLHSNLKCKLVFFSYNYCEDSSVGSAIDSINSTIKLDQCSFEQNFAKDNLNQIDGAENSIFIIIDSCIGIENNNFSYNNSEVKFQTEGVYFLKECNSIDGEIPESLEEIPIKFNIYSSYFSIGFVLSIIGIFILPIALILSLPNLFNNIEV